MPDVLPFVARTFLLVIVAGLVGLAAGWAHTTRTGDAR